jgi:hypothetical protein
MQICLPWKATSWKHNLILTINLQLDNQALKMNPKSKMRWFAARKKSRLKKRSQDQQDESQQNIHQCLLANLWQLHFSSQHNWDNSRQNPQNPNFHHDPSNYCDQFNNNNRQQQPPTANNNNNSNNNIKTTITTIADHKNKIKMPMKFNTKAIKTMTINTSINHTPWLDRKDAELSREVVQFPGLCSWDIF